MRNSLFGLTVFLLLLSINLLMGAPLWQPTSGPEGGDATAFYIDQDGHYWLGTGSSGGVFLSTNKGESWVERNKGLGPKHVLHFLTFLDRLYALIFVRQKETYQIYQFDKTKEAWKLIDPVNEIDGAEHPVVELFIDDWEGHKARLQEKYPLSFPAYNGGWDEAEETFWPNLAGSWGDITPLAGFSDMTPATTSWNRLFPSDVYLHDNGNIFYNQKNELVLLAKSGLYLADADKLKPMSKKGIVATDIVQLIKGPDNSLYALCSDSCIWYYKNKQWQCIYDFYTETLGKITRQPFLERSTRELALSPEGLLYFCSAGRAFSITPQGVKKELYSGRALQDINSGQTNPLFFLNLIKDRQGMYYGIALIESKAHLVFSSNLSESYSSLERFSNPYINSYGVLFYDTAGKIWYTYQGIIKQLGADADLSASLNLNEKQEKALYRFSWINCMAAGVKGRFAILPNVFDDNYKDYIAADFILLWEPGKGWKKIPVASKENIICLGMDSRNNLYAGTGYFSIWVSFMCSSHMRSMGGLAEGLFRLKGKEWLPIPGAPNPWIVSLASDSRGGLSVGTSGSGVYYYK